MHVLHRLLTEASNAYLLQHDTIGICCILLIHWKKHLEMSLYAKHHRLHGLIWQIFTSKVCYFWHFSRKYRENIDFVYSRVRWKTAHFPRGLIWPLLIYIVAQPRITGVSVLQHCHCDIVPLSFILKWVLIGNPPFSSPIESFTCGWTDMIGFAVIAAGHVCVPGTVLSNHLTSGRFC